MNFNHFDTSQPPATLQLGGKEETMFDVHHTRKGNKDGLGIAIAFLILLAIVITAGIAQALYPDLYESFNTFVHISFAPATWKQ